jgi:hypothetical protein
MRPLLTVAARKAFKAQSTADVVAGVNFTRANNLRLVVKGAGHSYQGTSNAPDSLLIPACRCIRCRRIFSSGEDPHLGSSEMWISNPL